MGAFVNEINTNTFTVYTLISLIISYSVIVIFYVFASVGIYTLAKRNNFQNKWMAWIPFLQYYVLGKLADRVTIFGSAVKNAGLITAIITFFNFVYNTVFNILVYTEPIKEYFAGNSVEIVVSKGLYIMSVVSIFIEIAEIFFIVSLLFAFFRKYNPRYAFLFTICAVFFDIGGLFIFLCRNKEPVVYGRPPFGAPNNPYGQNPYNGNTYNQNPYGQNPYNGNPYNQNPYGQSPYNQNPYNNPYGTPPRPKEPFSEFGENGTDANDPFAEFGNSDASQNVGQNTAQEDAGGDQNQSGDSQNQSGSDGRES